VHIDCLDLEGVLVPEIWIGLADRTGLDELRVTTRDIADYDELMRHRLGVLDRHGLGMPDIRIVAESLDVLPGARDFLDRLRSRYQVILLSDSYYEFTHAFMRRLGWPTLFCHSLDIEPSGRIAGYRLRQRDAKRRAVKAFHELCFRVVAAGDSYNDLAMLAEADAGILFRPPESLVREHPEFPVTRDYDAMRAAIDEAFARLEPGEADTGISATA